MGTPAIPPPPYVQEDNLKAACRAVGMRIVSLGRVAASFTGNYTLNDEAITHVVASVEQGLIENGKRQGYKD